MKRASIWLVQIAVPVLVLFIAGKCSAESLRDYYPLQVGNEWRYTEGLRGEPSDNAYVERKITSIVAFKGKEYFEITEGQRVFYQRYNVSGDTLLEYSEDLQQEFVRYHVGSDTLGQSLVQWLVRLDQLISKDG